MTRITERADGSGTEELLLKGSWVPSDWSRDGRFLVLDSAGGKTAWNVWMLTLAGERKPVPIRPSEFNERHGQLSPDGRWIAYQSDEAKTWQVFVQGLPPSSGRWQISTSGGGQPRWRRDGKELYYLTPDLKLMAVDMKTSGGALEPGTPRPLFQTKIAIPPSQSASNLDGDWQYDVSADGSRFLMVSRTEGTEAPPVTVVLNWFAGITK